MHRERTEPDSCRNTSAVRALSVLDLTIILEAIDRRSRSAGPAVLPESFFKRDRGGSSRQTQSSMEWGTNSPVNYINSLKINAQRERRASGGGQRRAPGMSVEFGVVLVNIKTPKKRLIDCTQVRNRGREFGGSCQGRGEESRTEEESCRSVCSQV